MIKISYVENKLSPRIFLNYFNGHQYFNIYNKYSSKHYIYKRNRHSFDETIYCLVASATKDLYFRKPITNNNGKYIQIYCKDEEWHQNGTFCVFEQKTYNKYK